ncbi:hypothetical protein GE09DRAFT_389426 [Coniochaeta sp. 2T2.1]|nr:hypothetical protein GE09DRAFT_389426 [Coniochaeta sp. 2T2.1]
MPFVPLNRRRDDIPMPDVMRDDPSGPSTVQSSSSADTTTPGQPRKERGAIAAQACDTCRNRKQRCDEQRPKCGTCQKFKLECNYREPQPTKKDRTLLEILDRIKGLENKIDELHDSTRSSIQPTNYHPMPSHMPSATATLSMSPGTMDPLSATQYHMTDPRSMELPSAGSGSDDQYIYASSATQMMGWPVFQHLLEPLKDKVPGLNPAAIETEGPGIVLGLHDPNRRLPLTADGTEGQANTVGPMFAQAPGGVPLTIATLTWETMDRLAKAYFDTLNFLFPLVDRQAFLSETLPTIVRTGFDERMTSTVTLIVLALGELAESATDGIPIRIYNGRPSGLRGGTAREPPGLALFNEARKRMGFNLTECSVENVQIFALAGLFYGACGHNTEQWRMTTSASLALQALISCKPAELQSPRGDLIRRAFWHCSMMETCITLELGMPTTGLERLEQIVRLPDFSSSFAEEDYIENQSTRFQEHFASQIVLRRLMMDFHNQLSGGSTSSDFQPPTGSPRFSSNSNTSQTNASVETIKNLAHQLNQWRGMLPIPLRWEEDSPGSFPAPNPEGEAFHPIPFPTAIHPLSPVPPVAGSGAIKQQPPASPAPNDAHTHAHHNRSLSQPPNQNNTTNPEDQQMMFTADLDSPARPYPYAYDIQVALLRTRYYYAKYLLHRPYVYKALHHPDSLTADDAQGVATCLRAALKWPVTMSPTCTRKRLIPCLYFWTQNVLGVLLVLHVARTDGMLREIVGGAGLCGENWEVEAGETVGLYVDWLRDLKEADPAAAFAWRIVRAVYGLQEDG